MGGMKILLVMTMKNDNMIEGWAEDNEEHHGDLMSCPVVMIFKPDIKHISRSNTFSSTTFILVPPNLAKQHTPQACQAHIAIEHLTNAT